MSDEHLCRTGSANHFCVCSMGRDHDSTLCRSDDERLPRPVSAPPADNTKSADPYMPTDADVKFNYASAPAATSPREVAADEFDRWLAAHDREVRDAALTEAAGRLPTLAGWNAAEAETIRLAQKRIRGLRSLQEGDK